MYNECVFCIAKNYYIIKICKAKFSLELKAESLEFNDYNGRL